MTCHTTTKHQPNLPSTQSRIRNSDDNIGLICDLGNRTLLNRYFVWFLEDHRSHRFLRHRCLVAEFNSLEFLKTMENRDDICK